MPIDFGWLRLGRDKQRVERDSSVEPLPLASRYNQLLTGSDQTTRTLYREAYRKNTIVYKSVSVIKNAVIQAPLIAIDAKTKEPQPESILQRILNKPNPSQGSKQFLKHCIAYYGIGGTGFIYKGRDNRGIISSLYPYHSSVITPVQAPLNYSGWVSMYRYDNGTDSPIDVIPENIGRIDYGVENFDRPYITDPVLLTALKEIDEDNEAARLGISLLLNGAVPSFAFKPPPPLPGEDYPTNAQMDAAEARLRLKTQGKRAGGPLVANGDVYKLGFSPKEMGNAFLREIPETRIPSIFDVPIGMTGLRVALEFSTYSNKDSDTQTFYNATVPNHWELIVDAFNDMLRGERFPDAPNMEWEVMFDTKQVRMLQESEDKKTDRVMKKWLSNFATMNECLTELGKENKPEGDIYYYQLTAPKQEAITKQLSLNGKINASL